MLTDYLLKIHISVHCQTIGPIDIEAKRTTLTTALAQLCIEKQQIKVHTNEYKYKQSNS